MATQPVPGVNITRYQSDLSDSDIATAQTVEVMCEQIAKAAQDSLVRKASSYAVERFRGGPIYALAGVDARSNPAAKAESVWWFAKHCLKFQHHDGMIAVYFNERDQLQLLISPDLLLRMGKPRGDCAIYTMLVCAMLKCLGIDSEIVTAAVDPNIPDVFSHVYPRAVLPGRRLTLDASHGDYPGWEVPPEHILRKQVWDLGGNPISDQAPRFKGLHAYAARPNKPILPKRIAMVPGVGMRGYIKSANRGLGLIRGGRRRGMGDLTTVDPSGNILDVNGNIVGNVNTTPNTGFGLPASPSGPSPFTNALAASLPGVIGSGMNILGNVVAPQVQYRGPGGIMYSAPAGSPAGSSLPSSIAALGTTSYLPLLLIGGGLLVVLFMVGKK